MYFKFENLKFQMEATAAECKGCGRRSFIPQEKPAVGEVAASTDTKEPAGCRRYKGKGRDGWGRRYVRSNGGQGDVGAIPFSTACGMHFVGLGVDQSTLMRVAAIDPVASAMGVPTPTASKLGGQSLKSKLPV